MAEGASAVSHDGRIIFCNPRLAEFLQMPCESLLGRPLADLVAVEDRVRFAELMKQAKAGPVRGRIGVVGAAGRALPLQVSASPLEQPEGTAVCIMATDLSEIEDTVRKLERARIESEALRDSAQRLRNSLAGAAVGLVISTLDGRIAEANPAFCLIVGYEVDELRQRTFRQLVHPDDLAENARLIEQLHAGEIDSFVVENRYVRKDGRPVWVRKSVSHVRDLAGAVQGHVTFVEDFSEQKRADDALRESEARFRLALKNSPVSVAVQNRNLQYIWAFNQRSATPDQIIGHYDHEIFTAEQAARITAIKRCVLDQGIEQREQMWFDRPSGRMYLDICWVPVRDAAGIVVGVASATLDMTPIKHAEDESKRQLEELHRWQAVMLDREGRNMELKREVNGLLSRLGEPIRYPSQAGEAETRR